MLWNLKFQLLQRYHFNDSVVKLYSLLNFWSAVNKLMVPELKGWIFYQLNKRNEETPGMRPIYNQSFQENPEIQKLEHLELKDQKQRRKESKKLNVGQLKAVPLTWWSAPGWPLCWPLQTGRAWCSWSSGCDCWGTAAGWRWRSGRGTGLQERTLSAHSSPCTQRAIKKQQCWRLMSGTLMEVHETKPTEGM